MIANPASENVVELQARLHDLTSHRAALHARVGVLDVGISEVTALLGEIEQRLKAQESEVARLMLAAGQPISFGNDYSQRTVRWTSGGETIQLSGPRPLDSPRGKADHARRVYDALEAEAQPIRASLAGLEHERQETKRAIGLLGGEIGGVEGQIARMRAEEAQRVELIGRLDWRARLATILRRLVNDAPMRTVQELRAEGKSIREIEAITGISKSEVQRQLSAAVPSGTADRLQGA